MVEGYTDVIAMHQCGLENVVANSGTALSDTQGTDAAPFHFKHHAHIDGDAGIKAIQGINMLLSEGMNVKVLLLPDGDDPDSFSRKHDSGSFRRYINEHEGELHPPFDIHADEGSIYGSCKTSGTHYGHCTKHRTGTRTKVLRYAYLKECAQLDADEAGDSRMKSDG